MIKLYGITGWSFENGRTVALGVVHAHDKREAEALAGRQAGCLKSLVVEVHELVGWEAKRFVQQSNKLNHWLS